MCWEVSLANNNNIYRFLHLYVMPEPNKIANKMVERKSSQQGLDK